MSNINILNNDFNYIEIINQITDQKQKISKERRRYFRVYEDKNHPISVHINGVNFIEMIKANDISLGGIGIVVPHEFQGCTIDRMVYLVVTLPKPLKKSFKTKGLIKHVIDKRFGVQFVGISETNQKLLRQYITYRLQAEDWLTQLKFKLHLI